VFPGGFRCFACNETFIVPWTKPFEELYPVEPDQITESDNASTYMPRIKWRLALEKRFIVINAPMGSGKTEQLRNLVRYLEHSNIENNKPDLLPRILVVTFQQLLAQQLAERFGFLCYIDLTNEALVSGPDMLTICLNSVMKLGSYTYNYLILDECGLIRRHFMSTTLYKSLEVVYNSFKYLLTKTQRVVMLQDGITENDVQFYTSVVGIEALNRRYVHGCCFQKPVEIHPIQMTLDFHPAVVNMLKCYKNSIQPGGACLHVFRVFCNSAVLAELFVAY
jgi:Origin of replication binding protein